MALSKLRCCWSGVDGAVPGQAKLPQPCIERRPEQGLEIRCPGWLEGETQKTERGMHRVDGA